MSAEHAMEHHEHEVILTGWPLVISVGALLLPLAFMATFSWKLPSMLSLIMAGVGLCAIIVGCFGWAAEVYAAKHDFGFGKVAVIVFIVSEALLFGGLFSGYFYSMIPSPVWPPATTPEGIPPLGTALFLSIFLLSSSGTIHFAEMRLEENNLNGFKKWLVFTMALGLIFIAGQAYEWSHLFAHKVACYTNEDYKTFVEKNASVDSILKEPLIKKAHGYVCIHTDEIPQATQSQLGAAFEEIKKKTKPFTISFNAFSTYFFTITGFHGSHVIIGLIMQAICLWLAVRQRIAHGKDTIVKATGYYWHFVDGIWLLVLSLMYVVPAFY
jgi:cytochrome c oxidase subunit 3